MFLLLAAFAALADARRSHRSRRHHRQSRNWGFNSNYKLFLTLWNRVFEGAKDFEREKHAVLTEYKEKVRNVDLEEWDNKNICMDNGVHLADEIAEDRLKHIVFSDSRRFTPDWKGQGVRPDPFDHPIDVCVTDTCKKASYSQNYGKHHRRIERVVMVLNSLGPKTDYGYGQSYLDIAAVMYSAAVRCKQISPEMAEAAAFAMIKKAVDRHIISVQWMTRLQGLTDILLRDVIEYPVHDEFSSQCNMQFIAAGVLLGARPLDVQYFTDALQFGDDTPLFVAVHRAFMIKARIQAQQKRSWFGRRRAPVAPRDGGDGHTIREVRSTYKQAVKYFKANRQRLAKAALLKLQ